MSAPLEETQRLLAAAFQRVAPVVDDPELSAACAGHVAGSERLTPAEQVDIYRRQFWLRHTDSLREDYVALAHVLGDDAFEAFCQGYLGAHPPRTPALRDLGDDIVAFAERYAGFPDERRELCVELVRYENAFVELFDGPEPPPLDPRKIAALAPEAWETARVVLHPLAVRLTVRHRVHDLRFAVRSGETPDLALLGAPAASPIELVLFRKELVIHYEVLAPEQARLFDRLASGTPLVPACSAIAEGLEPERAAALQGEVGRWFQQWTAWSLIVDVEP